MLAEWFPARNLLIATDRGLHEAGFLEAAKASLHANGFKVTMFDAVVAAPPEQVVLDCTELARAEEMDVVLCLVGGSSMDVAKLMAVLAIGGQALDGLYGIGKVRGKRLPLVQVPTTAGTGSEVTNITILTTGGETKMGVVADQLYADRVLLDAERTLGLWALHTAATGIDAMVHAIEAYTSRYKKNPLSDMAAREALRLLSANLVRACENGRDRAAGEAMLLGAMLVGQAFANAPLAAVHAFADPLGGRCHIPHGLSNALMLEPVLRFNMQAAALLYAELSSLVGAPPGANGFVARLMSLMDASGAPRRLRDAGIPEGLLPQLAQDAMLQARLLSNNPVSVSETDALKLYRSAY